MNKKIIFGLLAVAFVFLFLGMGILSVSIGIWQHELRKTSTDNEDVKAGEEKPAQPGIVNCNLDWSTISITLQTFHSMLDTCIDVLMYGASLLNES